MFGKKSILLLITSLSLISYCGSFRENNIPTVKESEYKSDKTEKIKVFSRWTYNSTAPDAIPRSDVHKRWFEKAILDSGCCIIVDKPTEATLVIDGAAFDRSHPLRIVPLFINIFTAMAIPYWATTTVDIQVAVNKGNKKYEYQLKDSFTMVQWLPMVFVFPFTGGPIKHRDELYINTYQALVVKIKKDGLL
ncbi:hypothetical protein [Leptospira terpstrae]|uniref:Lipoprotein n=1 Tax=Leptospira terpstrae serovar Hualin str. LT 11-33 = ATCC 700639 TaxID=1257025 RepID=N1W1R7_9LEPT|nr:hypothetical protein [Leptospira terpstrae]EMY62947.1 hypothetical protein LEP1GSC203_3371 [Leptospira terpstrae serovar Hualin str. LT 11-33 = ATCC 700639]